MSGHDHTRGAELLPAYALSALDADELRELEAHLASNCPDCQRDLWRLRQDLEDLASSVPPLDPDAQVRERILAAAAGDASLATAKAAAPDTRVRDTRERGAGSPARAGRAGSGKPSRWLALAAAVLLAVGLWSIWRQVTLEREVQRLAGERSRLAARAESAELRAAELTAQVQRAARALSVIAAPSVQSIALAGAGPAPGARGRTFVNGAERRALFYAFNLPPPPSGKTYELWFFDAKRPGHPVPAGTFDIDPAGRASVEVANLVPPQDIVAWAVTIEPAGGLPQPTGDIVLKG